MTSSRRVAYVLITGALVTLTCTCRGDLVPTATATLFLLMIYIAEVDINRSYDVLHSRQDNV